MSVKLRLTRMGRKKRPFYRIIAVDSRRKRDGAYIDRIGIYHPLENPPVVEVDADKALKWLRCGAQPSDTVRSLLRKEGVWLRFRLEKRGLPETQINQMMVEWFAAHPRPTSVRPVKTLQSVAVVELLVAASDPETAVSVDVATEPVTAGGVEIAATETGENAV